MGIRELPTLEPFALQDLFVEGIADIEPLSGGNARFTLFTTSNGERVAVAKLVAPLCAIPEAMEKTSMFLARKIGQTVVQGVKRLVS